MKTYTITLPDEIAAFVDKAVGDKKFDDHQNFFLYAVSLVENDLAQDELIDQEWLRKEIEKGLESSRRGEVAPLDMADILERARARLASEAEAAHAAGRANGRG